MRADVQRIVDEYPGARFALITFDASADLRMPLTTDTTSLISSLEVLRPEVTSQSRGSSIGIASAAARRDPARTRPSRRPIARAWCSTSATASRRSRPTPEPFDESAEFTDAGAVFGYGTAEGGPMQLTTGGLGRRRDSGEYIEYQGSRRAVGDRRGEPRGDRRRARRRVPAPHGRHRDRRCRRRRRPRRTTPSPDRSATSPSCTGSQRSWSSRCSAVELARATMLVARLRLLRARARVPPTRTTSVAAPSKRPSRLGSGSHEPVEATAAGRSVRRDDHPARRPQPRCSPRTVGAGASVGGSRSARCRSRSPPCCSSARS